MPSSQLCTKHAEKVLRQFHFRKLGAALIAATTALTTVFALTASLAQNAGTPSLLPPPEVRQNASAWPLPNHDYSSTRAASDSPISANTSANLSLLWSHQLTSGGAGNSLILGDTVYFQDLNSNIVALSLTDGSVKWQKTYDLPVLGPNGVAVGWGKVFASRGYYSLVALDADNGTEIWATNLSPQPSAGLTIQPSVFDNRVYVSTDAGGTGASAISSAGGTGVIYALDQSTGSIVWSFNTVDSASIWGNPTINYGGGSYQTPAIDTENGTTYWGISNAGPTPGTPQYPNGSSRPGPNLYTNSLIALDGAGRLSWFTQVYPHDLFNYGMSIPPILASANISGEEQNIVIGSGKTGRVYAFNRDDGHILWETIVGTHQNDQLAALPEGTTRVYPGGEGGVETPMAYADGVVYVPVIDMYADYTSSNSTDQDVFKATGELVAIEVDTGKIKWNVPLGSMCIGAATVVNDLVFTATLAGDIDAFSRETGELVWTYKLSPGVNGWPSVSGDTIIFLGSQNSKPALLAFKLDSGNVGIPNLTNAYSPGAAYSINGSSYSVLAGPVPQVGLQPIARGLVAPTAMVQAPDGRLFITDQPGLIRIVQNGSLLPTPFLDISAEITPLDPAYDERGLLGIALHPSFAQDGRVFVFYTAPLSPAGPRGWDHTNRVSEFTVSSSDPNQLDPASETVILQFDVRNSGPNGGQLAFGPDGYLYICCGDGVSEGKTAAGISPSPPAVGTGQNLTDFFGKILRIDVDHPSAAYGQYSIPPGNPFSQLATELERPEIFAYGFRDPSAISFDRSDSHLLYVANDGQALFESIDLVVNGGDYGWPLREGTHPFNSDNQDFPGTTGPTVGPNNELLVGPIIELGHDVGEAIIGGYVYRGTALPGLQGKYIFGDWSTAHPFPNGTLLVATPPPGWNSSVVPRAASQLTPADIAMWSPQRIAIATSANGLLNTTVRAFGQDSGGELYVLTSDNAGPSGTSGSVFKIVPPPSPPPPTSPPSSNPPPSTTPSVAPAIAILEPAPNNVLLESEVTVTVQVSGFNLVDKTGGPNIPGEGHIIYYLNVPPPTTPGVPATTAPASYLGTSFTSYFATASTSHTWTNLFEGGWTFSVQLVNNDNTPLVPPVTQTVTETIYPP